MLDAGCAALLEDAAGCTKLLEDDTGCTEASIQDGTPLRDTVAQLSSDPKKVLPNVNSTP